MKSMNGKQTAEQNGTWLSSGCALPDALAQAVHRLGGLAEGTAMVGLGAAPVVPVAAAAAQRVAAFDLDHEHALPGHQTEEVDLAGEPPPVVGDVEGVEDGPAGGVRACGPTAGPPAAGGAPAPSAEAASASNTARSPSLWVVSAMVGGMRRMVT